MNAKSHNEKEHLFRKMKYQHKYREKPRVLDQNSGFQSQLYLRQVTEYFRALLSAIKGGFAHLSQMVIVRIKGDHVCTVALTHNMHFVCIISTLFFLLSHKGHIQV